MPRNPPTHKRADVRAAIKLMESLGKTVTAVKYHPKVSPGRHVPGHDRRSRENNQAGTA